MDYNTWHDTFKPKQFADTQTGHPELLETYGDEHQKVLEANQLDPRTVWTLIDGDDGKSYVVNGYHHVNRIAYMITEVPFEGEFLEVLDSD